jgi:hypothetical protein
MCKFIYLTLGGWNHMVCNLCEGLKSRIKSAINLSERKRLETAFQDHINQMVTILLTLLDNIV